MRKVNWNPLYPDRDDKNKMRCFIRSGPHKDDIKELRRLIAPTAKGTGKDGIKLKRQLYTSAHTFNPDSNKQFCVTKARYSLNKKSHFKYLDTYMRQENKEAVQNKPVLFGSDYDEYKKNMTGKHFKFIISPDSQSVQLDTLIPQLVARMQRETGLSFFWQAAIHTDTPQKHAHLLINGTDRNGKDVKFLKSFITQRVTELASEICTDIVGYRTAEQIAAYKDRQKKANRWTVCDAQLLEQSKALAEHETKWNYEVRPITELQRQRLKHLTTMGLCTFRSNNTFYLEADIEKKLRGIGRYNSFLTEREKLGNEAWKLSLYESTMGAVQGTVQNVITMNDENIWNNAVVIKNQSGQLVYIPLFKPQDSSLIGTEIQYDHTKNTETGGISKIHNKDKFILR